jgi:anion-transporting  ArsA/GET3 family ATPase
VAVAKAGPIARQAGQIDAFLRDPASTGVLVTALPEEMPVNETVDFERALRHELEMDVDAIVVNALHPARFSASDARVLESLDGRGGFAAEAAVRAALSEHARARTERAQLRRLRRAVKAPVSTLPRIFEPELGRDELEQLSAELERKL